MARNDVELGWEWRAQRALDQRIGLRIDQIEKEKTGIFGILNAPSLDRSLPDPMNIQGTVSAVDRPGLISANQSISFRIPRMEMNDVEVGDWIALGIIKEKAVCLSRAPVDISKDNIGVWLVDAPCE